MSRAKKNHPTRTNSTVDRESELLQQLEIHYNQHMTAHAHYRTAVMRKGECLAAIYFCVDGFLINVNKSLETVKEIEKSYTLQEKKIPNHLIALKIKLMVLISRINLIISIMDTDHNTTTAESFNDILKELKKHQPTFNIKNNPSLQVEIHFAITKIVDYGEKNALKNYDKNESHLCGSLYMLQYNDGIPKFMAFRDSNKLSGSTLSLAKCTESFEAMNRQYNSSIGNQTFTLKDKISYLTALAWMYELAVKNNVFLKNVQLSSYNNNNKIAYVPENHPLLKYINILKEYKRTYLHKINALIVSISMEEIIEDITIVHEYHRFINDFYHFFQEQIRALISINTYLSENEEVFKYTVESRRWLVEFHIFNIELDNLIKDTFHNITLFKDQGKDTRYVNEIYVSEEKLTNFITLHAAYQNTNENTKRTFNAKADEDINLLLARKNLENKNRKNQTSQSNTKNNKPNNNTNTSQKQSPKSRNNKEKTTLVKTSKTLQEKAEDALKEKDYSEAMHFYKLYYFESKNTSEKLDALYGSIFSFEKMVMKTLKKINKIYGFSKELIQKSDATINDAKENIKNIGKQLESYNKLAQSLEKNTSDKTHKDVQVVKDILEKELKKIMDKITKLETIRSEAIKERERKVNVTQTSRGMNLFTPQKSQPSPTKIDANQFPTLLDTVETPIVNTNSCNLPTKEEEIPEIQPTNNLQIQEVQNTDVKPYIPKYKKVNLFVELQKTFNFLHEVKGQHYLVGSMVLFLLLTKDSKVTINPSDMDFLSLNSESNDWIRNGDFRQTTEEKLLFKLNKWSQHQPILPVEVWREETHNTLIDSLLTRDFTISALACDKDGNIIDPTGRGFDDFEKLQLSIIGDANERIEKSPCIILRAIKFSLMGFHFDEKLKTAILDWQPNSETDFTQLNTLSEKIFNTSDQNKFIELLKDNGLLSKLFNIADDTDTEEAKALLSTKLQSTSLKSNYSKQNQFFANAQLSLWEMKRKEIEEELMDLQKVSTEQVTTPVNI